MNSSVDPSILTPEFLDQLTEKLNLWLDQGEEAPDIEQMDGFVTAWVCGPVAWSAKDCLSRLFDASLLKKDAEGRQLVESFLEARAEQIREALAASVQTLDDEAVLQPLLTDWDSTDFDEIRADIPLGAVWVSGFFLCLEMLEDQWVLPLSDPDNEAIENQLEALENVVSDLDEMPPEAREMTEEERFADALWSIYELNDIWRQRTKNGEKKGSGAKKPNRKEHDIGRNEPCHCGSGKKFKKCHGGQLH